MLCRLPPPPFGAVGTVVFQGEAACEQESAGAQRSLLKCDMASAGVEDERAVSSAHAKGVSQGETKQNTLEEHTWVQYPGVSDGEAGELGSCWSLSSVETVLLPCAHHSSGQVIVIAPSSVPRGGRGGGGGAQCKDERKL